MSSNHQNWESRELGIGDPYLNPVFRSGKAYLEAAALYRGKLEKDAENWLALPDWYVLHHLSVIACELFLKSMKVELHEGPATSEDGPEDWYHSHAYDGHHVKFGSLSEDTVVALALYLSEHRMKLLDSIMDRKAANAEIARGRYPYEHIDGKDRFPKGEDAREKAEEWYQLAQSLFAFCKDEGGVPF